MLSGKSCDTSVMHDPGVNLPHVTAAGKTRVVEPAGNDEFAATDCNAMADGTD